MTLKIQSPNNVTPTAVEDVYMTVADMAPLYDDLTQYAIGSRIFSFGSNTSGQLGLFDVVHRSSPIQVGSTTNWKTISGGSSHTAAIKKDGSLWSWGGNTRGMLGIGDTTPKSSPVQVGSLTDWSSISCGYEITYAIKTDGSLWVWGHGTPSTVYSPVQVGSLTNWRIVVAARTSSQSVKYVLAVKTDGTLWSWGDNPNGQLGHGNTTSITSPVQVGLLTDWVDVSCGQTHCVAVKTNGTLWSWGSNTYGQLGALASVIERSSPVQVGALTNWETVRCGQMFNIAVKTTGAMWAWGQNTVGELGISGADRSSPVQVGALTTWDTVSCGQDHSIATKTDGTLWSWGYNNRGQLGTSLDPATTGSVSSPVQVGSLTNWNSISAGALYSLAISS